MAEQRRGGVVPNGWRRLAWVAALVLVALPWPAARAADAESRLSTYAYEDTRRLVDLVEQAAGLIEKQGETAFGAFAVRGSKWFDGSIYLFVYKLDGTCLFHAASPELIGRNLIGLRDLDGKPVIRYITDIGRQPEPDAFGWVFYLWQEGTQLSPSWKSTYVRKVVTRGGEALVVGSGLYDIKIEKAFVAERVGHAVELLKGAGIEAAFNAFRDPSSPFSFLDTYVFVLDETGQTLVDPSFPNMAGRDLSGFEDAVGMKPIAELLRKLAIADDAWVQYLWRRPGEPVPTRKLIYARKLTLDRMTLIVGSDYFLATPIWMRVEDARSWPSDPTG